MGRISRKLLVGEKTTNHCTWRAHDHGLFFEEPGARETFLELLAKYKERHGIKIHSYCLMGTHPHVMCTAELGQPAFSAFWKVVNWCFARWLNGRRKRCGQVVMERLRSPRVQSGEHQLTVMRYGDMNPVRAGLVKSPKEWPWSSYRHYAFGEANALIDDAHEYLALGKHPVERRKAYQGFFASPLVSDVKERRPELVLAPFIGTPTWVGRLRAASGLSPPR
jgi:putative transposase